MAQVKLLAPAKLNLGLEVLGRRSDGYHDIMTVYQAISIFDRISVDTALASTVDVTSSRPIEGDNLVDRALSLLAAGKCLQSRVHVHLSKRIPIAAGMGGASSDAAAILLFFRSECGVVSEHEFAILASQLGSDVPFFLRGGAAVGSGRGDELERLPRVQNVWFVIAIPSLHLERKTTTLYAQLDSRDYSAGARVSGVVRALSKGELPDPVDLSNAFTRALYEMRPEINDLAKEFVRSGAPFSALTGSGPAHYTIVRSLQQAQSITGALWRNRKSVEQVLIARPLAGGSIGNARKT